MLDSCLLLYQSLLSLIIIICGKSSTLCFVYFEFNIKVGLVMLG